MDIFNNNNQRRGHELGEVGDTGGVAWGRDDVNTHCRIIKRIKKIKLKKKRHQGINKAHLVCTL